MTGSLNAAVDMFLKLEGIKGEVKDERHKDEIDIESFSWGIANETSSLPSSGGGGGAGKVSMQDISFIVRVSKASPLIMLACASGQNKQAVFYIRKNGAETDFYILELNNVLVRKVHHSGRDESATAGDSTPMEEVAFYFENATLRYVAEDGSVTTGSTLPPTPR